MFRIHSSDELPTIAPSDTGDDASNSGSPRSDQSASIVDTEVESSRLAEGKALADTIAVVSVTIDPYGAGDQDGLLENPSNSPVHASIHSLNNSYHATALPARIIPELSDVDPSTSTGLLVTCCTATTTTTSSAGDKKVKFRVLPNVQEGNGDHASDDVDIIPFDIYDPRRIHKVSGSVQVNPSLSHCPPRRGRKHGAVLDWMVRGSTIRPSTRPRGTRSIVRMPALFSPL